eukprot:TRINITY_DN896_c4_g1_i1.p1 TRINITY_DN896_c4_g1~~TRINITY_DN896_c4_g1_i1.p1  ORF type:complete len:393 (+),score=91.01 TRINITY_DN896_c4_g1_i1:496-1674(+)
MHRGRVVNWQSRKGFGFVEDDEDGTEIFVHCSTFGGGDLEIGKLIYFDPTDDPERSGKRKAVNVSGPAVMERVRRDDRDDNRNRNRDNDRDRRGRDDNYAPFPDRRDRTPPRGSGYAPFPDGNRNNRSRIGDRPRDYNRGDDDRDRDYNRRGGDSYAPLPPSSSRYSAPGRDSDNNRNRDYRDSDSRPYSNNNRDGGNREKKQFYKRGESIDDGRDYVGPGTGGNNRGGGGNNRNRDYDDRDRNHNRDGDRNRDYNRGGGNRDFDNRSNNRDQQRGSYNRDGDRDRGYNRDGDRNRDYNRGGDRDRDNNRDGGNRRGGRRDYEGEVVKWADEKKFGFIRCRDFDDDVFCHQKALMKGGVLVEGEKVFFNRSKDDTGKWRAFDVTGPGVRQEY